MSRWAGYWTRRESERKTDAELAAMPRQGWGREWTITPDIGEHNDGCAFAPDHYGSCSTGPLKQAQAHRSRTDHVFYELPRGGGQMIYCGGSAWLPCAMCDEHDRADRLRGACLAMSRFLTFVWMEAFAQKWMKKTSRNVEHRLEDTDWRDHAFWQAWNKGLLKVTWP